MSGCDYRIRLFAMLCIFFGLYGCSDAATVIPLPERADAVFIADSASASIADSFADVGTSVDIQLSPGNDTPGTLNDIDGPITDTGRVAPGDIWAEADSEETPSDECPDDDTFFNTVLFPDVLELKCSGCHNPFGLAATTAFVLEPPELIGAEDTNFAMMQELVNETIQGVPVLLLRPSGMHPDGHTGGALTPVGSTDYGHLVEWTKRVIGTEDPCAEEVGVCDEVLPGPPVLRRLTRVEYDRTIESLFGFTSDWGGQFTAEVVEHGFDNQSDALTVTPLLAEQLQAAAEAIASKAVSEALPTILPCDPVEPGCAAEFIASFGLRAFRRPLTDQDLQRYLTLFSYAADLDGFSAGVELVLSAMLQSVHFLYRSELGVAGADGLYVLSPYEIATQLSYLLWGTMPDAELFDRAADGSLSSPEERVIQLQRLLDDPKAAWAVRRFATQWLDIGLVPQLPKDTATYPELTDSVRGAMLEEALSYVTSVFLSGQTFNTLFESKIRKMSPELATFYGLPNPGTNSEVDVTGTPYDSGVLGLGALLMAHAFPIGSSPVHRGALVREQMLCQELTPPPPGLVAQVPPVEPGTTTRERFEIHMSVQPCLDCHRLTDPIGFAFEHFDGVGRYREDENGLPIDDSGEIFATDTLNGPYDGAKEITIALGSSMEVRQCFVKQWFRYGYGRTPEAYLGCLEDWLDEQFVQGDTSFVGLLQALVLSPHFTGRVEPPEPAPLPTVEPEPVGTDSSDGSDDTDSGDGTDGMDGTDGTDGTDGVNGQLGDPNFVSSVVLDSEWAEGYCSNVTVENVGDVPGDWTAVVEISGTVTQVWNANYEILSTNTEAGSVEVSFSGVVWNKSLNPGMTVSFGFCAEKGVVDDTGGTPSPPASAEIEVDWAITVTSDWATGFCHDVTVTNTDSKSGVWRVTIDTPGQLNNVWDAQWNLVSNDNSSPSYEFEGYSYNASLEVGASTAFGYCGTK
jgi:hypothetical protein